ncbi:hypothetical protein PRZ48_006663 [Zasmidium cellare]|uniref:DUF7053 domain-containing protein n=1 Tax=Zasmidium cellare TaxID=395010 RepID=A0ABR0EPZ9_ZASCE|nr:hypothetical protein PRZ48_006663 [Zasmidium cellare]
MASTTWHNTITTPIPGDVEPTAVVKILHDHSFIITLNNLVTAHSKLRDEGQREIYSITDSIPILPPIWRRSVTYQASFENKDDGVETWVDAPLGLSMHGRFGEEGGWVLGEEVESKASVLLKGFVEKTMVNAHRKMHASVIERAREAKGEGADPGGTASTAPA